LIPSETVEEIMEAAQVEEVIGDFVNLKRRGVNLIGLCPFHNEKTPSFTVSPGKNIFKCFGCGVAGDSVKFLMEHENFSFPEALRYLANKYGIEIKEKEYSPEEKQAVELADSLYIVNEFARDFYRDQLFDTDRGKSVGLAYFKQRGFREEIIRKFGLGYAPAGRDHFTQAALAKSFPKEHLQKLGLTASHGGDFFRDRVMFTIHSLTGKPIAFAGRILKKDAKAPKYVNSPESEIYHKSRVLYGVYFAQRSIRRLDECLLVEGYTDVLSLHQAGIENVVASSGTALTSQQVRLVKRFTGNLTMLYDGDAAGQKAALRGADIALEADLNVKVVLLPEGEDPDSFLRSQGASAFRQFLSDQAEDFILFKTRRLLAAANDDPIKKATAAREVMSSLALIPDLLKRSTYLKECARLLELEESALANELNQQLQKNYQRKEREAARKTRQEGRTPSPVEHPRRQDEVTEELKGKVQGIGTPKVSGEVLHERELVRILIYAGEETIEEEGTTHSVAAYIIEQIEDAIEGLEDPVCQKIIKIVQDRLQDKLPVDAKFFIRHEDPEVKDFALNALQSPYEMSEGWRERDIELTTQKPPEENFVKETTQSVLQFQLTKTQRLLEENQKRMRELTQGPAQIDRRLKVHKRLLERRQALADKLGTVVMSPDPRKKGN
jgi:DNA primase